jgi:hypothetical protein
VLQSFETRMGCKRLVRGRNYSEQGGAGGSKSSSQDLHRIIYLIRPTYLFSQNFRRKTRLVIGNCLYTDRD